MARYHTDGSDTITTTRTTVALIAANASTPRRLALTSFTIGNALAPDDRVYVWDVSRITSVGSGGAAQYMEPLDPGDAASTAQSLQAPTGEPTTGNPVWGTLPINHRVSYTWSYEDEDAVIKVPATASNGLGWGTLHASVTPTMHVGINFDEL